jgi:hypothetical protein
MGAQGSADNLCMEGHSGPLCQVCVRATNVSQRLTFFDSNKDRCVDCPSTSGILGWAAAAVGSVVAVALLVHLLSPRLSRGCRRCANLLLHQITFYVYSLAAVPKLKLIFACYQVTVALPDTYDVEMPQDYREPSPFALLTAYADWMLRVCRQMALLARLVSVGLVSHRRWRLRCKKVRGQASVAWTRTPASLSGAGRVWSLAVRVLTRPRTYLQSTRGILT